MFSWFWSSKAVSTPQKDVDQLKVDLVEQQMKKYKLKLTTFTTLKEFTIGTITQVLSEEDKKKFDSNYGILGNVEFDPKCELSLNLPSILKTMDELSNKFTTEREQIKARMEFLDRGKSILDKYTLIFNAYTTEMEEIENATQEIIKVLNPVAVSSEETASEKKEEEEVIDTPKKLWSSFIDHANLADKIVKSAKISQPEWHNFVSSSQNFEKQINDTKINLKKVAKKE